MSRFVIVCFLTFAAVIFNLNTIDAGGPITTLGYSTDITSAADSFVTSAAGLTASGANVTESTAEATESTAEATESNAEATESTADGDEVTATTLEATSYIDDTAIFCRAYLLNNTNWEPFPTYSDNGADGLCAGLLALVGIISVGLFV